MPRDQRPRARHPHCPSARKPAAFPIGLSPSRPRRFCHLHILGCVRAPAGKRYDVVPDVTRTGAACAPGRRTRTLSLEFALDFGRSVFARRSRQAMQTISARMASSRQKPMALFHGGTLSR
jgi:hypothetical protein